MFREDFEETNGHARMNEDVFSKLVRAGKRTYFFDVKKTRGNDFYLTITESRRKSERDGHFSYDKHKVFLYKEDFVKFTDGLEEVISFIRQQCLENGIDIVEEEHLAKSESETEE